MISFLSYSGYVLLPFALACFLGLAFSFIGIIWDGSSKGQQKTEEVTPAASTSPKTSTEPSKSRAQTDAVEKGTAP